MDKKMKNKSAIDFLCKINSFSRDRCKIEGSIDNDVIKQMKKFAQHEVENALQAAAMLVPDCEDIHHTIPYELEESILNAYKVE